MENDKNLTPETEALETEAESIKKEKKAPKVKKEKKPKKLKNEALFKRGSYSLAITAAMVAAIIILNILVGALSDRFMLEFDMTSQKINSISTENVDFVKGVKEDVNVTVCADPEDYVGGLMQYYAYYQHGVSDSEATEYYEQTMKLIEKYGDYNKKINVEFVDTQSSEFNAVATKYANETLSYGDIIVSSVKNGNERHKIISFDDIYSINTDDSYGMSISTVTGNNIETALTGAIDYVISANSKKIGIITGHSKIDYTYTYYQKYLEMNNYEVEVISNELISKVSDELDALAIVAPTKDFLGSELDAISEFLDNDGKLGKGLVFFADARSPYLPNLYDFLSQWGIEIEEGILFETDEQNHMPQLPTTIGVYATGLDEVTDDISVCITNNNVPMTAGFDNNDGITVTALMSSTDTVVAAPVGSGDGWAGADDYEKSAYAAVLQAVKSDYDDDNNEISSYVMALGSAEYIYSDYVETELGNFDIALAVTEKALGGEESGISFAPKTITTESFSDKVTESDVKTINIIFVVILPLLVAAAGVYVYVKRRNA